RAVLRGCHGSVSNHDATLPAMPPRTTAALLLVAGALLAGCGSDDGSDDNGGTTTGATVSAEADYDITGSGRRELHQQGLDPVPVDARIQSLDDPTANTVRYGGIDCGGNWTYLGRDGAAFRFREVIDSGEGDNSKGVGIVTLTPFDADGVDYTFRGGGIESA